MDFILGLKTAVEIGHLKDQINTSKFPCPHLGSYADFREYLRDYFDYKRKSSDNYSLRPYSYTDFSAAADIKSPHYLKLIIDGKRNLSLSMIKKFSKALNLSKNDSAEFKALVLYGQARDPLERNRHLKSLSELRIKLKIRQGEINEEIWKRVPNWISWVLYTLVDQKNVDFELSQLKQVLRNKVSIEDLKRALSILVDSGELKRDGEGRMVKGRELINGYDDIPVAMIRKIQAELIYLGLESLFQDSPVEREFGALTLALTEKEFEHLKFELRQLRKRIYKDISVQRGLDKGSRVYQLNIQLFPVTDPVV